MNFSNEPRQLSDGRFFVKCTKSDTTERVFVQLNNTVMATDMTSTEPDVTICIDDRCVSRVAGVDTAAVQAAKEHSVDWFKRDLSEKTIGTAYASSLSAENAMNVTKLVLRGTDMTKVYDHERNEMDIDVPAGTVCDALLEFTGLWFLKKSFGPVWRLVQVRLKPPPKEKKVRRTNLSYMFQDEGEENGQDGGDDSESGDDDDEYM